MFSVCASQFDSFEMSMLRSRGLRLLVITVLVRQNNPGFLDGEITEFLSQRSTKGERAVCCREWMR